MDLPMEYKTEVTGCEEGVRISQIDECDTEHVIILSARQFLAIIAGEDELLQEHADYIAEIRNRRNDG
jgi:hypothetical protein